MGQAQSTEPASSSSAKTSAWVEAEGGRPFDDEAIMTLREVADRVRFTPKVVRKAINRGELLASRPGGDDFRLLGVDANAWWIATRVNPSSARHRALKPSNSVRPAQRQPRHRTDVPVISRSVK